MDEGMEGRMDKWIEGWMARNKDGCPFLRAQAQILARWFV